MAQTIQLKRHLGAALIPSTLEPGEPAYNDPGPGPGNLYIGSTGSAVRTLVSPTRQVELTGEQTITTGAGNAKTFDLTNLKIEGGDATDLLQTDGDGNLDWVSLGDLGGMTQVAVTTPPFGGTGVSGSPLTLSMAANSDMTTGTNTVLPVTAANVRFITGGLATLATTAQGTLVAAINELVGHIGDMTTLDTTSTTSLVEAVNEINTLVTTPGSIAVVVSSPISGDGTTATPLGLSFAATSDVNTGTNTTLPLNSALLRAVTGDVATLTTSVTTNLVAAINSIVTEVADALTAVSVTSPITGDGTSGDPLALSFAAGSDVSTGTNTTLPLNSALLRGVTGDIATLTTTVTTSLVAAINSLQGEVTALASPLRFMGTYNATAHTAEIDGGAAAALPAAAAGNEGYVLVVNTAGTGVAPAPAVAMSVGDWLVSNGTQWIFMDLNLHRSEERRVGKEC